MALPTSAWAESVPPRQQAVHHVLSLLLVVTRSPVSTAVGKRMRPQTSMLSRPNLAPLRMGLLRPPMRLLPFEVRVSRLLLEPCLHACPLTLVLLSNRRRSFCHRWCFFPFLRTGRRSSSSSRSRRRRRSSSSSSSSSTTTTTTTMEQPLRPQGQCPRTLRRSSPRRSPPPAAAAPSLRRSSRTTRRLPARFRPTPSPPDGDGPPAPPPPPPPPPQQQHGRRRLGPGARLGDATGRNVRRRGVDGTSARARGTGAAPDANTGTAAGPGSSSLAFPGDMRDWQLEDAVRFGGLVGVDVQPSDDATGAAARGQDDHLR